MRSRHLLPFLLILSASSALGQYFPKSSLGSSAGDQLKYQWYSAQLSGLQEPSLLALTTDPAAEVYRFTWLRSFHHPVAVRLTPKPDGTATLIVKVASGAGGFGPGQLVEDTAVPLTREQTQLFLLRVQKVNFWSLPNPVNDQNGTDGSQWIIEGVRHGRYHVVDRWSPTSGPVRELGELLAFALAKLNVPKREIY